MLDIVLTRVTVTAEPAYADTTVAVRSLAAIAEPETEEKQEEETVVKDNKGTELDKDEIDDKSYHDALAKYQLKQKIAEVE